MSRTDAHECMLEGSRPRWAAMLMLAFAASACSGTGVDETVFDEAGFDEAVLDEAGLDEPNSDHTLPLRTTFLGSREGDEPADPTEPNEGLTARSIPTEVGTYRWTKGEPNRVLMSATTHICALSMVRGHFASGTAISVEPSNGNWVIAGITQASGLLQVDAACVPKSVFLTNRGVALHANNGNVGFNRTNFTSSALLLSNTAPILSGITGAFNGYGEKVWVDPLQPPAIFFQNGGAAGWHIGKAHALNFGRDKAPNYSGSSELTLEPPTVWLDSPVGDLTSEFCYIDSLSGKWRGQAEWFQVYPHFASNQWVLGANTGSDGKIRASVRCLSIEQR